MAAGKKITQAASLIGGPAAGAKVMKTMKSVRNWAKDLPKDAKRQWDALTAPPTQGQKAISYAGSRTRAAVKRGQRNFGYGVGTTVLVDQLFGDSEEKTPAQLESKLNSIYNKVSRTADKGSSEEAASKYETKKRDVNRRKAMEDVKSAEKKRNVPPMPPKRPKDMNKGGYAKKSRTGSMDYRKGGLFR